MKNTKKLLILFCSIVVLAATVFSVVSSAVVAGEGTSIDEYTTKKITKQYTFEDGQAPSTGANGGYGGIMAATNVMRAAQPIYGGEYSKNYLHIDYNRNGGGAAHHYTQPVLANTAKVEQTPVNGFVAEFDIAFFLNNFTVEQVPKVDENGEIVYKTSGTDKDGNPVYVLDDNGEKVPVMVNAKEPLLNDTPKKDADGNVVYGEDGQPIYEPVLDGEGNPVMVDKATLGEYVGFDGSFAIDMYNTVTYKDGNVELLLITHNSADRTMTITVKITEESPNLAVGVPASYTFPAGEWLHVTIQYDAQSMLTHVYVGRDDLVYTDSEGTEHTGRLLLATKKTIDTKIENLGDAEGPVYPLAFRLGSHSAHGIVGFDNFIGYQGTTVHNPSLITEQRAYEKFTYVAGVLNNSESSFLNRYQAFDYLFNDAEMKNVYIGGGKYYGKDELGEPIMSISQEAQAALNAAIATYAEYNSDYYNNDSKGVYDAIVDALKDENADEYAKYVQLALDTPREINNFSERALRVTIADNYDTSLGNLVNRSGDTYRNAKVALETVRVTLAGDEAAFNFTNLMKIFDKSVAYGASLSRLQAHYENAKAVYPTITDYNEFATNSTSYKTLKAAVDSYLQADGKIANESRDLNSIRFINIVKVMQEKTTGTWANDGADVESLWYRALTILNSENYDPNTEGFSDSKKIFNLAHNYFWAKMQDKHIADLTAKLDTYNDASMSYIDRAGVCTYVDRYLEINAIDIDFENAEIIAAMERNESYKVQLNTLVGDYKNLLKQNTTKFINVMKRAAQYDSYADLKPLYDEATSYYYTMNVEGDGIDEYVESYAALHEMMKLVTADTESFIAIVNGTAEKATGGKYKALNTITDKAELYASLTAAYACLENFDITFEGAAAAKAIYDAKYAEYNGAIEVVNSQLEETEELACSARGNWDIDGVVSFIKNLFDMIKE